MASITLSSTTVGNGDQIPPDFKSAYACEEANRSPQLAWTYEGIVPGHMEHFNLYVENVDEVGNSPNGKFLHWGVQQIPVSQVSINEDGAWLGPGVVILDTDHPSGDRVNGWNGPCSSATAQLYRAWIEIKVKESAAPYIFGERPPKDLILRSAYYEFTDYPGNVSEGATTGDCGTELCPPGFVRVGEKCQQIQIVPVTLNTTQYEVVLGDYSPAWDQFGTRFYRDVDSYILPLKANSASSSVPVDDDGAGVALPFDTVTTGSLWISNHPARGRLGSVGIWADSDPGLQWIGFSRCIDVPVTGKYCIGLGADNQMRFKLNGELIAQWLDPVQENFKFWHVIEITLNQGVNVLEMEGLNNGAAAGFGFEIYQATIDDLISLTSISELNTSGYVLFSSLDALGEFFTIGETSGYTCPEGYAYDACSEEGCVKIEYRDPQPIECCYLIQNCVDESDQYLIRVTEEILPYMLIGHVYNFLGNNNTIDQYGNPKCFQLIDYVICDDPDMINVTIIEDFGRECEQCTVPAMFESCDTGEIVYVVMAAGNDGLVEGNIYRLNLESEGCYTYMGASSEYQASVNNVEVVTDFGTTDCIVCNGCMGIINCYTQQRLIIQLAEGQTYPSEDLAGQLVLILAGDPALENGCWKFTGYQTNCDNADINYIDVTIEDSYECDTCSVCYPYYKLTNCANPEDVVYIYWSPIVAPLDPTVAYVFSDIPTVDSTACYKAELQYRNCEDEPVDIYDASSISESYSDCATCNQLCYKLIDCETLEEIIVEDPDFAAYDGKVIKWYNTKTPEDLRCGTIESFLCRMPPEGLSEVPANVVDCFDTCEECDPPEPPEPEFVRPNRSVKPGVNVDPCQTDYLTDPCDDPCNT